MNVTIKDLAIKTGYTIATVSRALNNSPLVSEKTRNRILKAAEKIGYVPNEIARGLVKKKIQIVGIVVPDITNPYYPLLVKAIQETLQKSGYNIFLCNSNRNPDNELELLKMLYMHRVSGIIMDPSCNETYDNIQKLGFIIPIVFIGNRTNNEDTNFILVDNYKGTQLATEYLIRLGHKRIAFACEQQNTYVNEKRLQGYKETMLKEFNEIDETLIKFCTSSSEGGYSVVQEFIKDNNTPTAIVAGNDIIALGIIECANINGFKVAEDISVIGFDDIEYASLKSISLTTISQPRYQIGSKAAEMLLDIIKNNNTAAAEQIIIQPELIIRNSCAPRKEIIE